MPTVKKLQFANGTNITPPADLTLETAINSLPTFTDDAGYDVEYEVQEGSIYLNTTLKAPRMYLGGAWRTGIMQNNATDATKQVVLDTDGALTGVTHTLDFNGTANRVYSFPNETGTVVLTLAAQELENKTIKNGFLDGTKIRNGALDVEAAGALTIGATVGANNLTLGHADSTVQIPGNLTVSGTTTTVNTDTLDVEDKNITVNKGGNDATSAGAGLTVDRTGTKGSLVYDNAAASKFKVGNLGSEVEIVDLSSAQALTNKTINASLNTISNISSSMVTGTIAPSKGGTGVSNNDAATLTRTGNHPVTLTTTASTSVTLPTTGTLATVSDITTTSLQMSNKTLVESTIDNFIDINEETAPSAPGAGKLRVYAKVDGKLYKKDDTGVESEVGSGGAGTGRNYLQDWYDGLKAVSIASATIASDTGNRTVDGVENLKWAQSTLAGATVENNTVSPLRQTGDLKINSTASVIGAFVETPLFSLDRMDLGSTVGIEFDLYNPFTPTAYELLVIRYNSSGVYQQTIIPAGTASASALKGVVIPGGTNKFKSYFITSNSSSDLYALRFRKISFEDFDLQIDSLFVGPNKYIEGAIVSDWQSYTPTFTGFGTVTGVDAKWRRIGTSLQAQIKFTSGTVPLATIGRISIPSNLTINSSAQLKIVGTCATQRLTTSGNLNAALVFVASGQTTNVSFTNVADGTTKNLSEINSTAIFGNNVEQSLYFEVPISEWENLGTTTLAERTLEEYASNSNTSDTNDLTSFINGPDGSTMPGPLTAIRFKRVRFQSPILPTDTIFLETRRTTTSAWSVLTSSYDATSGFGSLQRQNITAYGMNIDSVQVGSTDLNVTFGQYLYPSGATYGSAGTNWSTSSGYWRVRKISAGAAIGYPVSARNIVGDRSGTVVPSGYIFEKITFTNRDISANTAGATPSTSSLGTLTPGVWILYFGWVNTTAAGSTGESVYLCNSSGLTFYSEVCYAYHNNAFSGRWTGLPATINLTSDTPIFAAAKAFGANHTVTVQGFAIRIG